jgi:mutator protein MutT
MIKVPETPPPQLVGRCAVSNREDELLLVKREDSAAHNAGLWEFPGGKVEIGEIIDQATLREVGEETGLEAYLTSNFVWVDRRMITDGVLAGSMYLMLCAAGRIARGELKLSREHTDSAWESYDAALGYELSPETRKAAVMLGELALLG